MITTYVVEGGLGKCIAFSALTKLLADKNQNKIRVYTSYPEVFMENPDVEWVLDQNTIDWDHEYIQKSDDIVYVEPYKSLFVKRKIHLIESYANLLGVEYNGELPKLYSNRVKDELLKAFNDGGINTNDYMIVQFTGGQSSVNWENNEYYSSMDNRRNYHSFFAQKLVNLLHKKYPNASILNYSLPNEPHYEHTLKLQMTPVHWHEALKGAKGFIGIDSSLQHLAASTGTKGVVIWGSTRWTQFGYPQNYNLNYYVENEWDEEKFNENNPINTMVLPEKVFKKYNEIQL